MKIIEEMLGRFESNIIAKIDRLNLKLKEDNHQLKQKALKGGIDTAKKILSDFKDFKKRVKNLSDYNGSPNYLTMESRDAARLFYAKKQTKLLANNKENQENSEE